MVNPIRDPVDSFGPAEWKGVAISTFPAGAEHFTMHHFRIRHRQDKEAFLAESGWIPNRAAARIFATPLEAISCVIREQIENAELIAEDCIEREVVVVPV